MLIPRLDRACKYYFIGEMLYRWSVPRVIEIDSTYQLKLMTDEPPTTHLSGKLRISNAYTASSTLFESASESTIYDVLGDRMMSVGLISLCLTLLAFCFVLRIRRRIGRIAS